MSVISPAQRLKDNKPKPTRAYSSKQEKQVAKNLGGKQTKNSGATMFGGKGDVLLEDWSLECKTKTSDSCSMSIKKEWLEKINKESLFDNKKYWALIFNFGPTDNKNYVIIEENTFKELLDYERNS